MAHSNQYDWINVSRAFLSVLFGIVISPASAQEMHIGTIAFFGQQGLDVAAIRAALPVHEGSSYPAAKAARETWEQNIRDAVKQQIGKAPTDVFLPCCEQGSILSLYIGLPGKSSRPVAYNAVPKGSARLPASFVKLGDDIDKGVGKVLQEGHGAEDDSAGYALFNDPAVRQMQLQVHDFALKHESLIYTVLATSSDSKHRSDAAAALGYSRQSRKQVEALVRASFDADDDVRNSAIRALAVLLTAKPELGRYVLAERLISLLNSERWTDRNKASLVLFAMTKTRDPELLGKLRAEAMPSLIEMSQFALGHAIANAVILGRVLGIEESELVVGKLSQPGKIQQIIHKAEGL